MLYQSLHSQGFAITLINATVTADAVKCGAMTVTANLDGASLRLYDFQTEELVCSIVIPDFAKNSPVGKAFGDTEDGIELVLALD